MAQESFKRKLTAIISADVAGYSRLMDDDEESTIRTLTAYCSAMTKLIQQYRGRVVDITGDNLMAEFSSAVDAVNCAVETQRELAERNSELSYERRMEFRIGVNVGDVIEENDRIYGDGVNIAARMEVLAEAGGICISGRVYDQVENKLDFEYEFLGEQEVKNIAKPIRAYRVLSYPGAAAHRVERAKRIVGKKWRNGLMAILAVLVLVAALAIWNSYFRLPSVEATSGKKITFDPPKGPSVAILPFVNLSEEPEQDYFSDGLTENIITSLSGCPKLFVIGRNSTFTFKGKTVKVQQVARELGVQYVVEGSVQKAKDRVRITVQLIDARTGYHLWAEKYDRDMRDIFALQDEITIKIITALEVKLTEGEQARLRLRGPANLEAFMKGLKALAYFRLFNKEGCVLARQEVEEAIALAPKHSGLYALLAMTHIMDLYLGSSKSSLISFAQASNSLKKAIALDKDNSDAHMILGSLYLMRREHEKAIAACERAVVLNPNGADAYTNLGFTLALSGRPEEAIKYHMKAIRLNPIPPSYYLHQLGHAYRILGRYEEAISAYEKAVHTQPTNVFAHIGLAATYILFGREEDARNEAAEVLKIDPKFSIDFYAKKRPFKNQAEKEVLIDALRKAGLPD
jgi:adenylate cyclase